MTTETKLNLMTINCICGKDMGCPLCEGMGKYDVDPDRLAAVLFEAIEANNHRTAAAEGIMDAYDQSNSFERSFIERVIVDLTGGHTFEDIILDSRRNGPTIHCPRCSKVAKAISEAFVEEGEWDGKSYAIEQTVQKYECVEHHEFYLPAE
ncbi:hypothetical protein ACP26L_35895 (plasmid) [Paenibacillus sp. S-38]|uniref:hypothetical protein n=1 Tax=Paenibacillus sp. S-38 TaxID=3416710 RepID=UPI003CE95BCC